METLREIGGQASDSLSPDKASYQSHTTHVDMMLHAASWPAFSSLTELDPLAFQPEIAFSQSAEKPVSTLEGTVLETSHHESGQMQLKIDNADTALDVVNSATGREPLKCSTSTCGNQNMGSQESHLFSVDWGESGQWT